jgi:hypothetical protein
MGRLRLTVIVLLIVADLAILFGTPFLETVGDVPRSLGYSFAHFGTDPAAAALPLVRVLLGAALLASTLDQIRIFMRRPTAVPPPNPPEWTPPATREPSAHHPLPERPLPAAMAIRDRWHDLPSWTWVEPAGVRNVQVGDTIWQVDRFTITIDTGIDFDEALRRIEVHDAFRQLADDAHDFDRRRAVVIALTAGKHWPFLGRSTFVLATARITAAVVSALDGVFVLRHHETQSGGSSGLLSGLAYLVAPTTAATMLVENDPDLVVALADQLDPQRSDLRDGTGLPYGTDLQHQLTTALAQVPPDPATGPDGGPSLSPPSQEAVFRIQPADTFQRARANTRDRRHIVSVARIDRIYLSTQTPTGLPIGTFRQVTAQAAGPDRPSP